MLFSRRRATRGPFVLRNILEPRAVSRAREETRVLISFNFGAFSPRARTPRQSFRAAAKLREDAIVLPRISAGNLPPEKISALGSQMVTTIKLIYRGKDRAESTRLARRYRARGKEIKGMKFE